MEDKPRSFYNFLTEKSNVEHQEKTPEKKPIKPIYKILAWIVIFISNSLLLQFCWNFGLKSLVDLPQITFIQSVMVYSLAKILTRGMFTIQ